MNLNLQCVSGNSKGVGELKHVLVQIADDIRQEPWHCKSYAICQSVYKGTPKMGLELNGKYQP